MWEIIQGREILSLNFAKPKRAFLFQFEIFKWFFLQSIEIKGIRVYNDDSGITEKYIFNLSLDM